MSFAEAFGVNAPEAYERLLMDVIRGNATLFMRRDEVEAAWAFIDPIRQAWAASERAATSLRRRQLGAVGLDRPDRARRPDLARGWRMSETEPARRLGSRATTIFRPAMRWPPRWLRRVADALAERLRVCTRGWPGRIWRHDAGSFLRSFVRADDRLERGRRHAWPTSAGSTKSPSDRTPGSCAGASCATRRLWRGSSR